MNSIERAQQRLARLSRAGVSIDVGTALARRADFQIQAPQRQVSIDRARLREFAGPWVKGSTPRAEEAAQAFLAIGAALMGNAHHQRTLGSSQAELRSTVAVVSARQGDGKTYCAWHVAHALLQHQAESVLLVDACGGSGSLTQRLGLPTDQGGLPALLGGQQDNWSQVVLGTDWPGLQVVPMPNVAERIEGQPAVTQWQQFLEQWVGRHHNRWVVLDMAALLPMPDSMVPLSYADQTVMVARSGQPLSEVQRAAKMLQGCPVVLGVLNQVDRPLAQVVRAG